MAASKRGPNFPKNPLSWAIEKGLVVYETEGMHSFPAESLARSLGYNGAKNGAAIRAIANLSVYKVIERESKGMYRVSEKLRDYKLVEDKKVKLEILSGWLNAPKVFSALLDKFSPLDLPSDNTLIYELVAIHGFKEDVAKIVLKSFKDSVNFVAETGGFKDLEAAIDLDYDESNPENNPQAIADTPPQPQRAGGIINSAIAASTSCQQDIIGIRIPILLAGGRKAFIELPEEFYEKDKIKLKAHLELMTTLDEEGYYE